MNSGGDGASAQGQQVQPSPENPRLPKNPKCGPDRPQGGPGCLARGPPALPPLSSAASGVKFPVTDLPTRHESNQEVIKCQVREKPPPASAPLGASPFLVAASGLTRRLVRISEEPGVTGRGRDSRD